MEHSVVWSIALAVIAGVVLYGVLRKRHGSTGAGSLHHSEEFDVVPGAEVIAQDPDRLPLRVTTSVLKALWCLDDRESEGGDDDEVPLSLRKGSDTSNPSRVDYSSMAVPSVWRTTRAAPEASREEWGFHITDDFRKAVRDLDKSMRGRVLDAITEICQHPMEVRGDTIKPLSGELAGCWRYRLGDYRLVYQPIKDVKRIDLLTIGSRGSIYLH